MIAYLIDGPAAEPLTATQAKLFLRVIDDAEDALVEALITSARLHIESVTGRALMSQHWRLSCDGWPTQHPLTLPVGPAIGLDAVTAYDSEGTPHLLDLGQFDIETGVTPARLHYPRFPDDLPTLRDRKAVEIDYEAGFGDEPIDVPGDLKQAMLVLIGYWFEHRDAVMSAGAGSVVPPGFDRLIAPYRRVRL